MAPPTLDVVNALYGEFFERGVRHFLPGTQITPHPGVRFEGRGAVEYAVRYPGRSLSEDEVRLVGAVNSVLSARYRSLFNATTNLTSFSLFRGLPEDHYVSAYLDPSPYAQPTATEKDRIADAIELLRLTSLTTYENRRVSTGALLLGSNPRPARDGAVAYTSALTAIKSFHRLSDGLRTVFLVNPDGLLVDLIDLADFDRGGSGAALPAPSSDVYRAHGLATLEGGHVCLALTPNGEIKAWANGAQQFNFLEGRWRLTEAAVCYRQWESAVGESRLAEALFRVALNLAEARRGGMFVVVAEPALARQFVSRGDLLFDGDGPRNAKDRIQYLLRGKRALDLSPTILETVSRIDGAIVLDRDSNLLAFGAILRHDLTAAPEAELVEGSRTTAAVESSRFGYVLKISEDGLVSFYRDRARIWEI